MRYIIRILHVNIWGTNSIIYLTDKSGLNLLIYRGVPNREEK